MHRAVNLTVWVVAAAGGLYVVVCLLLVLLQSRMVYYPTREIEATPELFGLAYEPVTFAAADGVKLTGWFVPADDQRAVVLICHGNGGNISHRVVLIDLLHRLGLGVFIFDYRGYGQSDGRPSERGTYLDAEAAWRYLTDRREIPADRIILHGRSLGAAVAAHLAKDCGPAMLLLESAFTSIDDMGAELYPWLPVRLLTRYHYSTIEYVAQVNCPVLIIHSADDRMIPPEHGRRLFAAAGEPKQFLEITGSHNDGYYESGAVYTDGLDEFITAHLGR